MGNLFDNAQHNRSQAKMDLLFLSLIIRQIFWNGNFDDTWESTVGHKVLGREAAFRKFYNSSGNGVILRSCLSNK